MQNFVLLIKRKYNMSSKKIDFLLPADVAAGATSGILLGNFNNWDSNQGVALKKQKDGSLKATVTLQAGLYEYRYLLNDGRWVNDTQASKYIPEFAVENCVIEVVADAPVAPAPKAKAVKAKTTAEPVAAKAPAKTAKAKTAEPKVETKAKAKKA
ncbi:hypothetical protein Emtol_1438 [Emticicia oligotrophica DSM 17448]|uniref:AMP-activated protein kinase glycogen-binding domain-containing protein n=2 Tax=Emticicia TaxID=312278 RepID=A0ABM5MZY9_EMTOG|nr:hypothetical protein Emtol_1438 [Emticicia oligotrophica DSM 17448]